MTKTLADLSRESGVPVATLHQRRLARRVTGRKIGSTLVFTAAECRRLLAHVPRGRPRKKRPAASGQPSGD